VREKAILSNQQKKAHEALGEVDKKEDKTKQARVWMCNNFYDVRTFGAVMSLKDYNCGQVRGPVQFSFSRSIEPIVPLDISITRMAVATEAEAEKQSGDNRTMGRKSIVPYGLYRCHGFVSAPLAQQTGFSEEDLELLWQALINMFEHDHSAARGEMAARKLIVFKHDSALGNAPAHKLFDLVGCARVNGADTPAREFGDYRIEIDEAAVPKGVTIQDMI
jgi:CRISPR-associated protein Csd2